MSHDLELNELMADKNWSDLQVARELRTRNHPDYNYSNTNYNSSCMKTTHLRPVPLGVLMTQHLGLNICTYVCTTHRSGHQIWKQYLIHATCQGRTVPAVPISLLALDGCGFSWCPSPGALVKPFLKRSFTHFRKLCNCLRIPGTL